MSKCRIRLNHQHQCCPPWAYTRSTMIRKPLMPRRGKVLNVHRPPFAISASEHQAEPEHLSLEEGRPTVSNKTSFSSSAPSSSNMQDNQIRSRDYYPDPVASNRYQATPAGPETPQQPIRTNSEDDHISSSRSRRLVTGYLLGNPPSPTGSGSRPVTPSGQQDVTIDVRNPTPPEENDMHHSGPLDSPPISVGAESREAESSIQRLAQMRINGKKPRQDSRVRDRETGYDRLNGLNDGEADLDESAPQAEGEGSEAFLRGVEGPSGEYHFPTHRLRTTMKGESTPARGVMPRLTV